MTLNFEAAGTVGGFLYVNGACTRPTDWTIEYGHNND